MTINKKVIISVIMIATVILIGATYYTKPKEYNKSITGIRYQLNNSSFEEKVQIETDGLYSKKILGGFNFEGDLYIDNMKFECSISDNSQGILNSNGRLSKNTERGYLYGSVFIDESLDELSIIFDGWGTGDGITIAAPAQNREEAINISNEVMKEALNKFNIGTFR